MQLSKGQNCALATQPIQLVCRWTTPACGDADLSALLLAKGRVRDDADFVFYNQVSSADGAINDLGKQRCGQQTEARFSADLTAVSAEVDSVVFVLSVDGPTASLIDLGPIRIAVRDAAETVLVLFAISDMTVETSAITLEVYRRGTVWKVRAVGQGYHDGLAGLARDFGVCIDDEPAAPFPEPGTQQHYSPVSLIDWTNPPVPAGYEL